jgi:hypothetical protein
VPVAILGDVDAADRERVRTSAEEALAALAAPDLRVPLRVVDDPHPDQERASGWVDDAGVHIVATGLGLSDRQLRRLVYHEVAHYFCRTEHPGLWGEYFEELWAHWFVARTLGGADRDRPYLDVDEGDSYQLGCLVGDALAGDEDAAEVLEGVDPRLRAILCDLVDYLDGIDDPAEFAQALADYRPAVPRDGAAVDPLLDAWEGMHGCG